MSLAKPILRTAISREVRGDPKVFEVSFPKGFWSIGTDDQKFATKKTKKTKKSRSPLLSDFAIYVKLS